MKKNDILAGGMFTSKFFRKVVQALVGENKKPKGKQINNNNRKEVRR